MQENEDNEEDDIKVILLGNTGVGKTNLINITMGQGFSETEKSTATSSFSLKKITINDKTHMIALWDTIGQEQYKQLTKIFFNNAKIVIFVYDITRKITFDALPDWKKDVEEQIGKDYVKGVVGNKSDLYLQEQVKEEEGEEYANNIEANFLLFSAKKDDPKKFEDYLRGLLEKYLLTKKEGNKGKFPLDKANTFEKKNKNNKNCCN
jgi:small GTP-binding protein